MRCQTDKSIECALQPRLVSLQSRFEARGEWRFRTILEEMRDATIKPTIYLRWRLLIEDRLGLNCGERDPDNWTNASMLQQGRWRKLLSVDRCNRLTSARREGYIGFPKSECMGDPWTGNLRREGNDNDGKLNGVRRCCEFQHLRLCPTRRHKCLDRSLGILGKMPSNAL